VLIEFTVANFRSVLSPQKLSLVAGTGSELESRNLIPGEHDGLRLTRTAVIYGANAAGKTNMLRAPATFRQLVEDTATKVQEGHRLNVAPFILSKASSAQPSEFELIFVADDGIRYHYFCAVAPERVHKEWMIAYPHGHAQRWFEREYDVEKGKYTWWSGPNFKAERAERKVWQDFTRANALFVSRAIQLNNDQLKPAFNWIMQKLIVLKQDINWNPVLTWSLLREDAGRQRVMQYMRAADVGIDRLELIEEGFAPALLGEPSPGAVPIDFAFTTNLRAREGCSSSRVGGFTRWSRARLLLSTSWIAASIPTRRDFSSGSSRVRRTRTMRSSSSRLSTQRFWMLTCSGEIKCGSWRSRPMDRRSCTRFWSTARGGTRHSNGAI
jgi:hypothetical protein